MVNDASVTQALDVDSATRRRVEEEILKAVRAIRYGSVEVTIHDSRVMQIERREKVRIEDGAEKPGQSRRR